MTSAQFHRLTAAMGNLHAALDALDETWREQLFEERCVLDVALRGVFDRVEELWLQGDRDGSWPLPDAPTRPAPRTFA